MSNGTFVLDCLDLTVNLVVRESLSTERYQAFESLALRESEPSDCKRTADTCGRLGDAGT
jgi:hypothetical protein